MKTLIEVFIERNADWQKALLEHLQISLLALLLAILLALPLSILLKNHRKSAEWLLQTTGIIQTIPSLAILGLLIPLTGIGTLPALIALVLYGVFPIAQSSLTAFWELDPQLEEAAEAFGMTQFEKLKKYQLALALPVIMAGIRTSAVMIVGTATLAALIGAGGLGSFILLGIDRNDSALLLIGAISSALLAVLISALLKFLSKRSLKSVGASFLALLLLTGGSVVYPFSHMESDRHLVIAGKLGAEPDILINMYKALIEANSRIKVDLKPNFGKTTFLYEALKSGSIDIYPEFTGTVTSSLLKEAPSRSTDERRVYEEAKQGIYDQDKLVLLEPMAYENTYALATSKAYAQANGLEKISDLKKVESSAKAGFTLEFNDREDGNKGLKSLYGLNLQVQTLEPALRYQALAQNNVQIVDVYSTDSQIISNDLLVLKDDQHLFPPYQGAPLLREETLKKYPELAPILNQLAGKITSDQMAQMNYAVDVKGQTAEQVARDYLRSVGLLN